VFAVDAGTGVLTPVDWEPTQGKTPRFFTLDPSGRYLYAANQDSDTIVCFRVDPGSGKLSSTGNVVKTGSPSSIVFVYARQCPRLPALDSVSAASSSIATS